MSRRTTKKEIDEQKPSETSILDAHEIIDSESRFAGLDLDYYRERIPPEQFRLLLEFAGVYRASGGFDPDSIFYPEDL
jgi:hypothetical protein